MRISLVVVLLGTFLLLADIGHSANTDNVNSRDDTECNPVTDKECKQDPGPGGGWYLRIDKIKSIIKRSLKKKKNT